MRCQVTRVFQYLFVQTSVFFQIIEFCHFYAQLLLELIRWSNYNLSFKVPMYNFLISKFNHNFWITYKIFCSCCISQFMIAKIRVVYFSNWNWSFLLYSQVNADIMGKCKFWSNWFSRTLSNIWHNEWL